MLARCVPILCIQCIHFSIGVQESVHQVGTMFHGDMSTNDNDIVACFSNRNDFLCGFIEVTKHLFVQAYMVSMLQNLHSGIK